MRRFGRSAGALGWGFFFLQFLSACAQRPQAVVVPDFQARRPLQVVVLPVAYVAEMKVPLLPPLQVENLQSPEYAIALKRSMDLKDPTRERLRRQVAQELLSRGVEIIDMKRVENNIGRFLSTAGFNARQFAAAVDADSLVFLNLYEWQFITQSGQHQRGTLRVLFETALFNVARGDLIWLNKNHPTVMHYATQNTGLAQRLLAEKIVNSVFEQYPQNEHR